ncbi:MAG: PH domain-containing protein, partial [Dehalococcoidia bacterium]|nr:PH domain-containing protein [Dehalococcoidia bacterium]
PLSQITDIVAGADYGAPRRFSGVRWPGYAIGKGEVDGVGPVMFYSTHRDPADLVYLLTTDIAYGLSPADATAFTEALTRAGRQATSAVAEPLTEFGGILRFAIWHDRWALAIAGAALAGNLLLVAYVLYYYPTLPDLLPLHFNVVGDPDFIGPRQEVFRLPAIAFGLLTVNVVLAALLYHRERLASYIALGVGLLLQAMFWVATTRIVY